MVMLMRSEGRLYPCRTIKCITANGGGVVGRMADIQIMEERGAPLLGKIGGSSENFVWKRTKRRKQKES